MTDDECGPRNLKSPTSKGYAIQTLRALKRYLASKEVDEQRVAEELSRIEKYRHWKVLGYKSKSAMFLAEGITDKLKAIKIRAAAMSTKQINSGDGPLTKEEKDNGDIITVNPTGKGTSADYLTARIARDFPHILKRMQAGEFSSVRKAAIEAGIVKPPTKLDILKKTWKKATDDERCAFLAYINEHRAATVPPIA